MLDSKMIDHDNHQEITIETLTSPPPHIQPAPLTRRFAAVLIDSLIVGLSWVAIAHVSVQLPFLELTLISELILLLLSLFYYFAMEWLFSATLGKFVMKIRVVGTEGDPCTITESTIRNLFRIIDWLPFCYTLGLLALLTTNKRQRVGDRIAHTIVTMFPERDKTPPPAPFLFH